MGIASCNRMLTLINGLLDLARLESGKMVLNIQETALKTVFDTSVQQVSALAARSDVNVISQIDDGIETIQADAEVTVRILVNLLSNALKYSPEDSTVVVSAVPYTIEFVAIRVADTGPGIPKEWVNKVFSKFTQVEAREAGIGVGSGLGLSFCRLAVEAQGGRIWVESVVGQGTTVIFTVPQTVP
jgi:signal transduction histidine kinase